MTSTGMNRATRRAAAKSERRRTGRRLVAGLGAAGLAASGAVLAASPASAAGFTVTTLADSGAGSLRQAILDANAAPGADTITFDSTVTGTITLTSGEIAIGDDTTISGPGAGALTVSGGGESRIFQLLGNPDYGSAPRVVSISGITLAEGATKGNGGAIQGNYAIDLTLQSVVISGNTAYDGGGVYMHDHLGSVVITDSVVSGNTAQGQGGGLYLRHTHVTLDDVEVTGNSAAYTGGGIQLYETLPFISDSVVSGNTVDGHGGGIYAFSSNSAPYQETPYAGPTIVNSVIADNRALGDGGGLFSATRIGGGESEGEDGPVTTTTVIGSTISGNTAGNSGGGAAFFGEGRADIVDSTVSGNTAAVAGGIVAFARGGRGPEVAAVVEPLMAPLAVGLVNVTISANTATDEGATSALLLVDGASAAVDHVTVAGNAGTGPAIELLMYDDGEDGGEDYKVSSLELREGPERSGDRVRVQSFALPLAVDPAAGTAAVRNSIVVNPASAVDLGTGAIVVESTLIGVPGTNPAATGSAGNVVGVDPKLGPLSNNGGSTLTMLPAPGSPAINAGNAAIGVAPALDQRGLPRVSGAATDMGAVEVQSVLVATGPADATRYDGESVSFSASATGDPAITVQWQVSSDGGTTWTNVAGATEPTLTFTALLEQDGLRFRAVFSNPSGTATTDSALLTVLGLAKTGAEVTQALPLGAALVAIGAAMTAFARRRRSS